MLMALAKKARINKRSILSTVLRFGAVGGFRRGASMRLVPARFSLAARPRSQVRTDLEFPPSHAVGRLNMDDRERSPSEPDVRDECLAVLTRVR